jgi:hypothetical protein
LNQGNQVFRLNQRKITKMGSNPFVNPPDQVAEQIGKNKVRKQYPPIEESLAEIDAMMDAQDFSAAEQFANMTCQDQAINLIYWFVKNRLDPTDGKHVTFSLDEVYVVSFTYILGNWSAMLNTTLPDGMYYEATYMKSSGIVQINAYKRCGQDKLQTWPRKGTAEYEEQAKMAVHSYVVTNTAYAINADAVSVHLLSFRHILYFWKAFLVTNINDEMRYEATFDSEFQVIYLDKYKLFETEEMAIPSGEAGA